MNDNEFVLSFLHKPQTDITTKFYYAFTFPFTYTECQNQLARFDGLYLKTDDEMKYILQRLNVDVDVDVNCNTINFENSDSEAVENVQNILNGNSSLFVITSDDQHHQTYVKCNFIYFSRTTKSKSRIIFIAHQYFGKSIE